MATTVIGAVLESSGIKKKEEAGDPTRQFKDLRFQIYAGEQLNATTAGGPLSLVTRIYILRAPDRMKFLSQNQIETQEGEKEVLAGDLISSREVILLPGRTNDLILKVPGDATAIGVAGMFRAPYRDRWKLVFDAKSSIETGITVGAHACAFNTSKGTVIAENPLSFQTLTGVRCDSSHGFL